MNVYCHQPIDNLYDNISSVVGMSNYRMPVNETMAYYRAYYEQENIKKYFKNIKLLNFYCIRGDDSIVDWKNIPDAKKIILEKVCVKFDNIHFSFQNTLEHIEIINCNLESFPYKYIHKRIRTLNLSHNSLSGTISLSHTCIRFIHVNNNNISHIELPYDCHTINASHNQLESIELYNPVMIANVSHNKLKTIRVSKWCEKLDVSSNELTNLSIHMCLKIQEINASSNRLNGILSLDNNKSIKYLNVAHNFIEWISGLSELNQLEYLNLSHNKFETMEIPFSPELKKICVNNNPLKLWEWKYLHPESDSLIKNVTTSLLNTMIGSKNEYLFRVNDNKTKCRVCIDMSYIHCEEFEDISDSISYLLDKYKDCSVHVSFYGNNYVEIPYHPKLRIHLGKTQMQEWKNQGTNETRKKLNILENQNFFVVDSAY